MKTNIANFERIVLRSRRCAAFYFCIFGALLLLFSQTAQAVTTATTATTATTSVTVASVDDQKYMVLCYHSVPARFNGDGGANSVANFTAHLAWLRENGYVAISMDDVLEAKAGRKRLPQRAYMLTVDDGYADFYVNVFPVLKAYKIPAVLAVVGRWIVNGRDEEESRVDPFYAQQQFVTWAQVREMSDSGLVEIASHSYDLHHGVMANPQNNLQPAAITPYYNAEENSYETAEHRRLRVRNDLRFNSMLIEQNTGKPPRIMVWPYGKMDRIGGEEAKRVGMPINMTLIDGHASVGNTEIIPRTLIQKELRLSDFSYMVRHKETLKEREPVRAMRLTLDRVYDPDPQRQEENFGRLLDQTALLGVNTVLLQPFAMAPGGDVATNAKANAAGGPLPVEAYFPNVMMPMRADLLNRVAWQMHSRLNVEVFLVIDSTMLARGGYSRAEIIKLYSELSLHVPVQGVLFDNASVDFDLLSHMNYWPLPNIYATARQPRLPGADGGLTVYASDRLIDGFVVARPAGGEATGLAALDAFARALPTDRINVLALSLKGAEGANGANSDIYRKMPAEVRFFQYRGIKDFLVDGDDFLDDPKKIDLVRQAVSLKSNPFSVRGE